MKWLALLSLLGCRDKAPGEYRTYTPAPVATPANITARLLDGGMTEVVVDGKRYEMGENQYFSPGHGVTDSVPLDHPPLMIWIVKPGQIQVFEGH